MLRNGGQRDKNAVSQRLARGVVKTAGPSGRGLSIYGVMMSVTVKALITIAVIALVAEYSPKLGWGLAILAAMGMIAVYFRRNK